MVCEGKVVLVLNQLSTMPKSYMGELRYHLTITVPSLALDGGKWLTSCTGCFNFPPRNSPKYLLHMKLGRPHNESQCCRRKENFAPASNCTLTNHPTACGYTG